MNGPNPFVQMTALTTPDAAKRHVDYWADAGATSFKAYMQISRAVLGAAIQAAHARGLKVTGHICSVTYAEAAALGIDNLEHGFFAATDFVADKQPDVCPGQGRGQQTIADLDPQGAPFKALVKTLIDKRRRAHLHAHGLRGRHAGPSRAAGPRRAAALAARAVRGEPGAHGRQHHAVGDAARCSPRRCSSNARSSAPAACSSPAPIPRAAAA